MSLFADDMIICVGRSKQSIYKLLSINESSKKLECKIQQKVFSIKYFQ